MHSGPCPRRQPRGSSWWSVVDGQGGPMLKAEAVQLNATLGPGETRQTKQEARVGGSYTVAATPRAPAVLAELLVDPEAARARRQRADTRTRRPAPSRSGGSPAGCERSGRCWSAAARLRNAAIPSPAKPWSSCAMAPPACGAWRPSASRRGGA